MKKKDIIIFGMSSIEDYKKGVENRNYQVLSHLMKSNKINKIIFVNFLPFNLKKAIKVYFRDILASQSNFISGNLFFRINKYNKNVFSFSTVSNLISRKRFLNELNYTMNKLGIETPTVWSFNPLNLDFLGNINHGKFVFDAVDNWIEHPSFNLLKDKLRVNYEIIARKADIIFTVSKNLTGFFASLGRQNGVYHIPNGVDYDFFNNYQSIAPEDIKSLKRPVIGYVGVIQNRIDFELLYYLAEKFPELSFVLVGPIWTSPLKRLFQKGMHKKLSRCKNVFFLGMKEYQAIPAYYKNFDVGIIPHKYNQFTKSMNPLKLYMYFACGVPVVSTAVLSEFNEIDSLVYYANNYKEFGSKLFLALKENNDKIIKKRKSFAKCNNWKEKIDYMLEKVVFNTTTDR